MDSKKLLLFVFIIFFSAVVSSSAHDTDLYMSSGEGVEPNILVIFDNSGSMNDLIQAYFYDPATTYPNERCFTCNPQTAIYNEMGRLSPLTGLNCGNGFTSKGFLIEEIGVT